MSNICNIEIAEHIQKLALMSEYCGENPFKVQAYKKAAGTLETVEFEIDAEFLADETKTIGGIGKGIRLIIEQFVTTGTSDAYGELIKKVPEDFFLMLSLPGIGIKKLKSICEALEVNKLDDLLGAAKKAMIRELKGFSEKSEAGIISGIEYINSFKNSKLYCQIEGLGENIKSILTEFKGVIGVDYCGEFSRGLPVINTFEFILNLSEFNDYKEISDCLRREISMVLIKSDELKLDFEDTILKARALTFKVNSSDFLVNILALTAGCDTFAELKTLMSYSPKYMSHILDSEFSFKAAFDDPVRAFSERISGAVRILTAAEGVYEKYSISPRHSELAWKNFDRAELLSRGLFNADDIKGVFHIHSQYSDGLDTLGQICEKALMNGYSYIGMADHSKSSFYANGLSAERLMRQLDEIDALNEKYSPFRIFKGVECDILSDGTLDYDDSVLTKLDYVIASVHQNFKMPGDKMTERVCRALSNPYVTMLGHPTGRLLNQRRGYEIDMHEVMNAAAKYRKLIELNCNPYRMDVDYKYLPEMERLGIMTSINPDAHTASDIGAVKFGINALNLGAARREMVLNTMTADRISGIFQKIRSR